MTVEARTSRKRSISRLALATFATVGVVFVAAFADALPASAAALALSGGVACHNGDHLITWTIANDSSQTVTITSALTAKDPDSFAVSGYDPTLAPGATTHGTTVIPGSETGTVVLYVYETWAEGSGSDHTQLDLGDPCPAVTTTTTAASSTTTTTIAATTTVPTTTTTLAVAGSTVAAAAPGSSSTLAPLAQLPRTGSGTAGPVAGAVTLVVGGLALVLSGRKRHRRAR